MTPAYVWPLIILVLGGVALWRAEAVVRSHLSRKVSSTEEKLLDLRERQMDADITERTLDEATELRKAELRRQTTEQDSARELLATLQSHKAETEAKVIHADAVARMRLAEEFARERHAQGLQQDLVGEYERYLDSVADRCLDYQSFASFVATLRSGS